MLCNSAPARLPLAKASASSAPPSSDTSSGLEVRLGEGVSRGFLEAEIPCPTPF